MSKRARGHFRRQLVLGAITALGSTAGAARADEPMFGYVNATDLLPKGRWQVEQWLTDRSGDASGRYDLLEGRIEADVGLADNLQLTGYLNYARLDAQIGPHLPPGVRLSSSGGLSRRRLDGVTGEAIWRLASPYLGPVGLALLVDGTVGHGQRSVGLKAIIQKNFRDDTLVVAANARAEFGLKEKAPGATLPLGLRSVTPIDLAAGVSYRFRPNWSAALEARDRIKQAGPGFGSQLDSGLFLGPTVHYGGQRWFLTLSAMRRVAGRHRAPDRGLIADSLAFATDRLDWDGARLRIGRTF